MTLEQINAVRAKSGLAPLTQPGKLPLPQSPSLTERLGLNKIKEAATGTVGNIVSDISGAGEKVVAHSEKYKSLRQSPVFVDRAKALGLETAHNVGAITGGTAHAIAEPAKTIIGSAIKPVVDTASDSSVVQKVATSDPVDAAAKTALNIKEKIDQWIKENPEKAHLAGDAVNLAEFLALGLVKSKNVSDIHPIESTKQVANIIGGDIKSGVNTVAAPIKSVTDIAQTRVENIKNKITGVGEKAKAAESFTKGDVTDASTAKFTLGENKLKKSLDDFVKDFENSDNSALHKRWIEEGVVPREKIYKSGNILTDDVAKGRIDDVANKLKEIDPIFGEEFRTKIATKSELTMDDIMKEGHNVLRGALEKKLSVDPLAQEAIKQGIDESDVALAKSMSAADKADANKMLDIIEKSKSDRVFGGKNRSTDVSGQTYVEPARFLKQVNTEAAKQLDDVAKSELVGKKLDISEAKSAFIKEMENKGVTFNEEGTPNFTNSQFKRLPSAQKELIDLADDIKSLGDDAYDIHNFKRTIDTRVGYGKVSEEGLKGSPELIAKNFRHNIDGALDKNFSAYNKVNTQFSETFNQLDEIQRLLGKNNPLDGELVNKTAGTLMRRVLSNAKSKEEVLKLISDTEDLAVKYGFKLNKSAYNQVLFADLVEKMFGTEASTSHFGQIERAVRAAGDAASGNFFGVATKMGEAGYNAARGISFDAKVAALRALLKKGAEETI